MATFKFPLEPVLGVRKRSENQQQIVFATAMARLQAEQRTCDDLFRRRLDMHGRLRASHGEMDVEELRMTYAHCDFLERAIKAQQAVIERFRLAAEVERAKLVEFTKQKKILETLKSQRYDAFVAEAAAAEQRESDDINARRYDRATANRETPV